MNLQKTFLPVLMLISLCFTSCSNDDDNRDDAKVMVTVVSAAGERLSGEIVRMFDEKTYEAYKRDNRTDPTAYVLTDSNGMATFVFSYDEWFKSNRDRFFTFAVQYGSGSENYAIWSAGRTIRPGATVHIELELKEMK
ncbi:hypothetical protein [Bacteroides helcogenes]|uniref:Lipoprotein n=1 Tax=Bacteroides helcogenes (strain ATCC 35417 / DSM 20613 / JCM 6297 / CCUG 15421 / P 36-108) TaxID=693979 RepID=E6SV58_BACT6|nr:hypothetical protein [Bacteroides helcogenes]ADV43440.1 hypothetical protein Bache_1435 [Bacteroides helcogenes P 36-108]MDY5238207.1 hypothetical protein [Bacteroides helcogenes]